MLAFKDFRSNIVWRATNSALLFAIMLKLSGQSKVADLQTRVAIEEEISELEIAMNHTPPMQILQCHYELIQVEHGLGFCQPLAWTLAHKLVQSLVRAYLKDDVDILAVLKVIIEVHYLVVI
jgi:hypothetical protein